MVSQQRIIRIYVDWSKQHGFKPVVLREIVFLRDKGYSNVEIERETGFSRNTVSNYLDKMRRMHEEEISEMLSLIGLMRLKQKKLLNELLEGRV